MDIKTFADAILWCAYNGAKLTYVVTSGDLLVARVTKGEMWAEWATSCVQVRNSFTASEQCIELAINAVNKLRSVL